MKYHESYPVFIIYNELASRNMLPNTDALDIIWEHCIAEYELFTQSQYNEYTRSEFDCIVDYIKSQES